MLRGNKSYWRIIGATIVVVLCLMVSNTKPLIQAQGNPGVLPPNSHAFGKTYGEWSAAWWEYVLNIPTPTNPVLDETGQDCGVGQSGRVFFLAGSNTSDPVTRVCTVPVGTPIFFPIINAECSDVEADPFFGSTDEERLACAQEIIDGVGINTLKATIDGKEVKYLHRFRVASPPFEFTMPALENFLGLDGVTSGSSVSDGYWLMLHPLSPGSHVIHFEGAFVSGVGTGFSQNVTYHLTVI
jgi:hypothetical protein